MPTCKNFPAPQATGPCYGPETVSFGVGVGNNRQTFGVHKTLLQNTTSSFNLHLASDAGQKGLVFLNDDDPKVFREFHHWLYHKSLNQAPTTIPYKKMPGAAERARLEANLRVRFDARLRELFEVYCFAEKYKINDLKNDALDGIQSGFYGYGTVFGPDLTRCIFERTKPSSKLRNLCVATNVIHLDRGCEQLREEIAMAALTLPGYMSHMLKWISRNFHMFGRRFDEGYDSHKPMEGFSVSNFHKFCPCLFHEHDEEGAHVHDKTCIPEYNTCGHGEENEADAAKKPSEMMVRVLSEVMDAHVEFKCNCGRDHDHPAGDEMMIDINELFHRT